MTFSVRDLTFAGMCMALASMHFAEVVVDLIPWLNPASQACADTSIPPEELPERFGLSAYDPRTGLLPGATNYFTCVITQLFRGIADDGIGGAFGGLALASLLLPVITLICLEAGRRDAWWPAKNAVFHIAMFQAVGACFAIPLFWLPSYFLFGGRKGGLTKRRIQLSILPALFLLVAAIATFSIPTTSSAWPTAAGVLGGSMVPLATLPVWLFGGTSPDVRDHAAAKQSSELAVMVYAFAGLVSFVVWLVIVALFWVPKAGLDLIVIYEMAWSEASPPVKFITSEIMSIWLYMILYIAYHKPKAALEAFGLSLCFGPGAAISITLASLEVELRDPRANKDEPLAIQPEPTPGAKNNS